MAFSSKFPEDDWFGVSDPKIRRLVQNRLNQRAYRARKQAKQCGKKRHTEEAPSSRPARSINETTATAPIGSQVLQWTWAPANLPELMILYERLVMESYQLGSPQADHLISLSRLNIWRAANDNIVAAGMTIEYLWADESISLFSVASVNAAKEAVPASLWPTSLQRTLPHHPWFDIFPFPTMRDNFLRAGDTFDEDELCHDLMGFWDPRRTDATLLVWGIPWDPLNWEVTEAFARKWGWTLRGCPEILKSTNYWRAWRGEKPLIWREVLFSPMLDLKSTC
ncbi:bZIP transcription factor [Aspergillus ibericus CBS 121593]|uniref:BZIP domain-containing protein n=1 Tax=Aspergillus ibericus CBS 121593 TaxID=1448316 RepID=A0A395H7F8_9EURO|nr:hypothetical protein BO80DRAFT_453560 [Aspergillus ibericus CBS 121593]RAL02818.1 hypothetical protein BO80DRAFT_453560 [Aspergillus ibericus CBS 121593]